MQNLRNVVKLTLGVVLICTVCLALAFLALNEAPRRLAVLLGLEHVGPLESALPHDPPRLALDGVQLDRVELLLPPHVNDPLSLTPTELGGVPIIGTSTSGTSTYLLTLDETSLNDLLRRRLFPDGLGGGRYRDVHVDLQPGGLALYADVHLGLRWQQMGLLLLQDEESEPTLARAGLVLNQELYALPEDGFLARTLLPVEAYAQRMLEALTIVGPLPGEAHTEQIHFHPDRLQILAQATYAAPPPPDTGWQLLEPGVELREIDVTVATERPTERLWIVRLDPAQVRFRVHYDPAHPRPVSTWAVQLQPLLVVNAGYFAPENEGGETIGLLISDGQRWGTPLGDFAGMFAVAADGRVNVRWLRERPYDPEEPLVEAVQSFPLLVKPGGVIGFPADADDGTPARRTVIAQDQNGDILIVVAPRGYLGLHELAVFLTESDLAVDVALNLDGGGSTGLWLAASEASVAIDSLTPVPSVIVVERR